MFLIDTLQALGITHCDLHAENILITTYMIETPYERYTLQDGKVFYVPNCGKRVVFWDMTFARDRTVPCPAAMQMVEMYRKRFDLAFPSPVLEDLHFVIEVLNAAKHKYKFYYYLVVCLRHLCFTDTSWGLYDLIHFLFFRWTDPIMIMDDSPVFDFRV